MKKNYIIATKKISALGSFTGRSNTFSPKEIEEMKEQSFTESVGAFTPSLFKVSAGLGMQEAGIHLSTEMFFESVPDEYVDVSLDNWHFDESAKVIPIIIPRNYLTLYNFGFAQRRNLPKLSEGLPPENNSGSPSLHGLGKPTFRPRQRSPAFPPHRRGEEPCRHSRQRLFPTTAL